MFFSSQRKPEKESHSAKEGGIRKSRFFKKKYYPEAKRKVWRFFLKNPKGLTLSSLSCRLTFACFFGFSSVISRRPLFWGGWSGDGAGASEAMRKVGRVCFPLTAGLAGFLLVECSFFRTEQLPCERPEWSGGMKRSERLKVERSGTE